MHLASCPEPYGASNGGLELVPLSNHIQQLSNGDDIPRLPLILPVFFHGSSLFSADLKLPVMLGVESLVRTCAGSQCN